VLVGDARDAATYEEAGVERDSLILAATTNDELNLLVAELVHAEFGVEHPVVAIQQPPEELGRRSRAWIDVFGGRAVDVPRWIRSIENHQVREMVIDPRSEEALAALRAVEKEHSGGVLRLMGMQRGEPDLHVHDDQIQQLDTLTVLVRDGQPHKMLEPFRVTDEEPTGVVERVADNNATAPADNGPSKGVEEDREKVSPERSQPI
jgi:Trk K+ transport system NAD-binding subunit